MNRFIHNGSMGDIIYAIPVILKLGGGVLHLSDPGGRICEKRLKRHYDFLEPLLSCAYKGVFGFSPNSPDLTGWRADKVFDLRRYRYFCNANAKAGKIEHLSICHSRSVGISPADLKKKWLEIDVPVSMADIVINCTTRYHDKEEIDWSLLKDKDVIFFGRSRDYRQFCDKSGFEPLCFAPSSALDVARLIAGSKIFIGNQSLGFALAEAMKHPRVLEVCYKKDNCRPNGKDGYTYLNNDLLERYLN